MVEIVEFIFTQALLLVRVVFIAALIGFGFGLGVFAAMRLRR